MSRNAGVFSIDPQKQLGEIVPVGHILNLKKIRDGENNTCVYHKMNEWFLNDLTELVGSPQGFTSDQDAHCFWINGDDMIWFAILGFSRDDGRYLGLRSVNGKRRPKGSRILVGAREYKEKRTEELNTMIRLFEAKALKLGYLL